MIPMLSMKACVCAQMEAQEYLASCACPEYLRKAERRLAEEVERCVNYLDPSSEAKITAVVEQELIRKQASWCMMDHLVPVESTATLGIPPVCSKPRATAAGHGSALQCYSCLNRPLCCRGYVRKILEKVTHDARLLLSPGADAGASGDGGVGAGALARGGQVRGPLAHV